MHTQQCKLSQAMADIAMFLFAQVYALLMRVPGIGINKENNTASYFVANMVFLAGVFSFAAVIGKYPQRSSKQHRTPACAGPCSRPHSACVSRGVGATLHAGLVCTISNLAVVVCSSAVPGIVSDEIKIGIKNSRAGNYNMRLDGHIVLLNWNSSSTALLRHIASAYAVSELRRRLSLLINRAPIGHASQMMPGCVVPAHNSKQKGLHARCSHCSFIAQVSRTVCCVASAGGRHV